MMKKVTLKVALLAVGVLAILVTVLAEGPGGYIIQDGNVWYRGTVKAATLSATTLSATTVSATTVSATTLSVTAPTSFDALLATTAAVNVGSAMAQTVYTVPAGKSAVITHIIFRNASGTFDQAVDPVFSIGWNSTTYDNVVASATYTNAMVAAANFFCLVPDGKTNATVATAGTAGQALKINVTTAATASTTCAVDVFGYLY